MAHSDNDTDAKLTYETPTFDPRSAFSWTLRAGEIAAAEARRQRDARSGPTSTAVEQRSESFVRV
jgi:hypothetical protein